MSFQISFQKRKQIMKYIFFPFLSLTLLSLTLLSLTNLSLTNSFLIQMSLNIHKEELCETAYQLSSKGILAMDESTSTIGKRFKPLSIENTMENRQAYRELLLTCPYLENYISGVILFEETLYQNHTNGTSFVSILENKNIIPGIKVDQGLDTLYGGNQNETMTLGIEGLYERCRHYYNQGVRFTKWRALLQIHENGSPTDTAIQENTWALGRYARIVQEAGLVPIVECEVFLNGSHTIETMSIVQEKVLQNVYKNLIKNNVLLEGTLLKPSITVQGLQHKTCPSGDVVAKMTLDTLQKFVPCSVPGIMFLSGGLSEKEASHYLNCINRRKKNVPWSLSFCFGRALQDSCLNTWKGKKENIKMAQQNLLIRAKKNYDAVRGKLV